MSDAPRPALLCRIANFKYLPRYLVALGLVSCAACNRGGLEVVPVEGSVVFEGRKQPAVCRLLFLPNEGGGAALHRPSMATMQSDGTFEVTPFQGTQGLVPGTYKVRVTYYDLKPGSDSNQETNWIRKEYAAPNLQIDSGSSSITHNITVPLKK
jgi:hypothetical protein